HNAKPDQAKDIISAGAKEAVELAKIF
ncbi:TPA: FMN-dependent NADH-azoreductase, partial [Listeria monocytogenes]|nr:FMN-dependent NADH-azoreductase [Listeria monocytogenes]